MTAIRKDLEPIRIAITVDVPYRFAAGSHMAVFLTELRDRGRFLGIECPRCKRVQMPPRIVCAPCHVKNERWVELGNEGVLAGFTIMYLPLTDPTTGKPHEPPFVYGSVRLDGCDSVIDHFIDVDPDPERIRVGMRLRAVLKPRRERVGDLGDIVHFTPVDTRADGEAGRSGGPLPEAPAAEAFEVDQHITARSGYFAGEVGTCFLTLLRDEKRILGSRCPACGRVYWPPRATCPGCFERMSVRHLREIGPEGTLETFTEVAYRESVHPRRAPFVYGVVKLDGADTGLAHFIGGIEAGDLAIGMRMAPVFEERRSGSILDIAYFKPVGSGTKG